VGSIVKQWLAMNTAQQTLTLIYSDILSHLSLHWFDRSREQDPEYAKLSGLFLLGTS
jgi:hypothetical protein